MSEHAPVWMLLAAGAAGNVVTYHPAFNRLLGRGAWPFYAWTCTLLSFDAVIVYASHDVDHEVYLIYIPVLLFAVATLEPWPAGGVLVLAVGTAPDRSLELVITLALVGTILGWLRLSSGSIFASAASNATLTLCAGLPLVLAGMSSSTSAVFEPAGWLPLVAIIGAIAWVPAWRAAVAIPIAPLPDHVN